MRGQGHLDAIHGAALKGIPVVLGGFFVPQSGKTNLKVPELFTASQLRDVKGLNCSISSCPSYGYLNAPTDMRLIPTPREVETASKSKEQMNSFASAITSSLPSAGNGEGLRSDSVFGSFIPEQKFPSVSTLQVQLKSPEALRACYHRIVLIGGHWHDLESFGNPVDVHVSPVGQISGLGLHANYIESLLQHQYTKEPPLWIGLLADLLVGLVIYVSFEATERWIRFLILALAFLLPLVISYLALVSVNRYLDFLLPLELYAFHILYEVIQGYFDAVRSRSAIETAP